jgi:probable HAF family extracellular repeat protein
MWDNQVFGGIGLGINEAGYVVGRYSSNTTPPLPGPGIPAGGGFIWDPKTRQFQDIGDLGGSFVEAKGINNSGLVVGSSQNFDGEPRAFLWDSVNGMRNLGTLGGNFSRGTAVNNLGQAVGWSTNNGLEQAFIYDLDGVMKPLGTLEQSRATAINDLGIVVGVEFGVAGFYWDNVNGITHLPPNIVPVDINNFGVIVGGGQIWSRQTGTQSLTDLLPVGHAWSEITINAINDSGQIVGYGRINDEFYGFVATPIPEPSHIILTIAFGVFVIFRRSPVAASVGKKLRRVRGSPST